MTILLDLEGGYGNDPADAGGETKYGISQAAFPYLDIKTLTVARAKEIYRVEYWEPYHCGELPWPLGFVLFDSVVQFNPHRAVRWLQGAVGAEVDGHLGAQTLAAATACSRPVDGALEIMLQRSDYRGTRPNYGRFGKGWRRRDLIVLCEAVSPHA